MDEVRTKMTKGATTYRENNDIQNGFENWQNRMKMSVNLEGYCYEVIS